MEDIIKDHELKYQEVIESSQKFNENTKNREINKHEDINVTSLLIEVSEYKGKSNMDTLTIKKLKEEKETLIGENRQRLLNLSKELNLCKEKSLLYETFSMKLEKEGITFVDVFTLKQNNLRSNMIIKDQEEKIKALKSIDESDKGKLFKKIEEINFELTKEKQKNDDYQREKNELIRRCVELDRENQQLESQLSNYRNNDMTNMTNMNSMLNFNTAEVTDIINYSSNFNNNINPLEEIAYEKENLALRNKVLDLEIKIQSLEMEIDQLNKKKLEFVQKDVSNGKTKNTICDKCDENNKSINDLKSDIEYLKFQHKEELHTLSVMLYTLGSECTTYKFRSLHK